MAEDIAFLEQRFSNVFVDSLSSMLKSMLNVNIEKSASERHYGFSTLSGYSVAVGVVGDIKASVLYEFGIDFANKATEILNDKKKVEYESIDEFYTILRGVLNEIGNIVSGHAVGLLYEDKIDCDITPPFFYYGSGLQILPKNQEIISMKFNSKFGDITIVIAMEVNRK